VNVELSAPFFGDLMKETFRQLMEIIIGEPVIIVEEKPVTPEDDGYCD